MTIISDSVAYVNARLFSKKKKELNIYLHTMGN